MKTLISGVMGKEVVKEYTNFKFGIQEYKVICVINKEGEMVHFGKENINGVLDKYNKFKILEFIHDYNEMVIEEVA